MSSLSVVSQSSITTKVVLIVLLCAALYGAYSYIRMRQLVDVGVGLVRSATAYEQHPKGPAHRVLVLGDSSGFGVGATTPQESVAGRIGLRNPDTDITNIAVSGARLKDVPKQLTNARIQHDVKYDRIFLHIGGNDIVHGTSLSAMQVQLQGVLEDIAPLSDDIVLIHGGNIGTAPFFPKIAQPYFTWKSKQARRLYLQVVGDDTRFTVLNLHPERALDPYAQEPHIYFAADSFHPSSEGYRVWFEEIDRIGKAGFKK